MARSLNELLDTDHGDQIEREIETVLSEHFCAEKGDWLSRWKEDRYFAKYRIGDIEETISFTPREVEDSLSAPANFMLANAHDLKRSERALEVGDFVIPLSEWGMQDLEDYVRIKHKLPIVPTISDHHHAVIEALACKLPSQRDEFDGWVWSLIVFACVIGFISQPVSANCLIIEDRPPVDRDFFNRCAWSQQLTKREIAHVKGELMRSGVRLLSSSRMDDISPDRPVPGVQLIAPKTVSFAMTDQIMSLQPSTVEL